MSNNDQTTIGPGKRIRMHFAVLLLDGSVVDSNFDADPVEFSFGDGNLLPGFEQSLVGLVPGDKRSILLTADQAFGPRNDDNVQRLRRTLFARDMVLEPGLVVAFADNSKTEIPGVVMSADDELVVVDFNHPLAGKDLTFKVEILSVLAADQQPVKFGGNDGH